MPNKIEYVCPFCYCSVTKSSTWCEDCQKAIKPLEREIKEYKPTSNTSNASYSSPTNITNNSTSITEFLSAPFEFALKSVAILNIIFISILGGFLGNIVSHIINEEGYLKILFIPLGIIIGFIIGWITTSLFFGLIFSFLAHKSNCEVIKDNTNKILSLLQQQHK